MAGPSLLSIECEHLDCSEKVATNTNKHIQLCAGHVVDNTAMLQQASKAAPLVIGDVKKSLKDYLEELLLSDKPEYLKYLQTFSLKSPRPGKRGVPRLQFDFATLRKSATSGNRAESRKGRRPMCYEDYIDWYTQGCSRYLRLSAEAAEKKWSIDFNRLEREQRDGNDLQGNPIGKVWVLWVPVNEEKANVGYHDNSLSLDASVEQKAPTSSQLQKMKEQTDAMWTNEDCLFDYTGASNTASKMLDDLTGLCSSPLGGRGDHGVGSGGAERGSGSAGAGNKKRRSNPGSGSGSGPGNAGNQGDGGGGVVNMAVEAQKVKKNTVKELISVKQALTRARTALEGASSKFDPAVPVAQHSEEQKLISLRLEIVAMCLPKPGEFGDTPKTVADWKERNAMLQASLEKDPFLIAQAGERLKDCCVFPYLEWSRNGLPILADSVGPLLRPKVLWPLSPGLAQLDALVDTSSFAVGILKDAATASQTVVNQWVQTVNALQKLIRDEETNKAKEEERLEKLSKREEQRENKKRKQMEAAEEKKRAAQAKRDAQKSEKKEKKEKGKKKRPADSESGSEDDKGKAKKQRVPRTRGQFDETDPPLLVRGSNLPASYRLDCSKSMKEFLERVIQNEPAILRNKKGSVRKVCSRSLKNYKPDEAKSFTAQTAKQFSTVQANVNASGKKMTEDRVRTNNTTAVNDQIATILGFDILLNAMIASKKNTDGEGEGGRRLPFVMDRVKLAPVLEDFLVSKDAADPKSVHNKILGATWTFFNKGNTWAGFTPTNLGFFYYQQEGNKVMAVAFYPELCEAGQAKRDYVAKRAGTDDAMAVDSGFGTVKETVEWFQGLTPEVVAKMGSEDSCAVPSLKYIYLSPGDVLYVPCSSLLVEKCMNSDSIGFRIASMQLFGHEKKSFDFMDSHIPMTSLQVGWQKVLDEPDFRQKMEYVISAGNLVPPLTESEDEEGQPQQPQPEVKPGVQTKEEQPDDPVQPGAEAKQVEPEAASAEAEKPEAEKPEAGTEGDGLERALEESMSVDFPDLFGPQPDVSMLEVKTPAVPLLRFGKVSLINVLQHCRGVWQDDVEKTAEHVRRLIDKVFSMDEILVLFDQASCHPRLPEYLEEIFLTPSCDTFVFGGENQERKADDLASFLCWLCGKGTDAASSSASGKSAEQVAIPVEPVGAEGKFPTTVESANGADQKDQLDQQEETAPTEVGGKDETSEAAPADGVHDEPVPTVEVGKQEDQKDQHEETDPTKVGGKDEKPEAASADGVQDEPVLTVEVGKQEDQKDQREETDPTKAGGKDEKPEAAHADGVQDTPVPTVEVGKQEDQKDQREETDPTKAGGKDEKQEAAPADGVQDTPVPTVEVGKQEDQKDQQKETDPTEVSGADEKPEAAPADGVQEKPVPTVEVGKQEDQKDQQKEPAAPADGVQDKPVPTVEVGKQEDQKDQQKETDPTKVGGKDEQQEAAPADGVQDKPVPTVEVGKQEDQKDQQKETAPAPSVTLALPQAEDKRGWNWRSKAPPSVKAPVPPPPPPPQIVEPLSPISKIKAKAKKSYKDSEQQSLNAFWQPVPVAPTATPPPPKQHSLGGFPPVTPTLPKPKVSSLSKSGATEKSKPPRRG